MMIGLTAGCGGDVFTTAAAAIAMAASPTRGQAVLPCAAGVRVGGGDPRAAELPPARAW
ncbi:hypothetical protein ACIBQ1_35150 [Nonomuraea sp. NPDC050153]|uniref:hypothetical protein n=1 Tax=Nonomuraea sp. NPDC050153 TaxID=3364359 RepID=UPI00378B2B0A